MKFKLSKSKHIAFFNLLRLINKLNLINKDNKQLNNNSLIFYNNDNQLYISCSNNYISSYFNLGVDIESDDSFAVDVNLFFNAFNNFPSDEINFAYLNDKSSLVLGNKKTKVILNSVPVNNLDEHLELNFNFDENLKFKKLNTNSFSECLKFTSFSCSSLNDDYPFTNILVSLQENSFNGASTDKHRISIYGNDSFENDLFLLSKTSCDLLTAYLKEFNLFKYALSQNKLFLKTENGLLSILIDKNTKSFSYNDLIRFIDKSESLLETKIDKNDISKSLKFVSSISSSDTIDFRFSENKLFLSNSNSDKGAVADTIFLDNSCDLLEITYLSNHVIKVIELIDDEKINFNIRNYNGYNILIIESSSFKHVLFPME